MIETHAHIYYDPFDNDIDETINRAKEVGVKKIFLPNVDSSSIERMLSLEERYPDYCVAMMGLHPCSVKENYEEELDLVTSWLEKRKFVAVGEIGLDLYWDKTFFEQQKHAFQYQMDLAKKHEIPFVIHSRDSNEEVIEILEKNAGDHLKGIFHCFSGTVEQAQRVVDVGMYIGIGGVVTFKNGGLNKVVPDIDLKNIVLETDSPYLTPVPFRGKRNEPSYLTYIVEKIAELKGISVEEVKEVTTQNALNAFEPRGSNI
jgi:TatD DNase family protein